MRLIIAGGREFSNYELLRDSVDMFIADHYVNYDPTVEIVSGTARGTDTLGEQYAQERGFKVMRFPANWDLHGKLGGLNRNLQMAEYASHCICFHDGVSTGTAHMIKTAKKQGLITEVINY